MIKNIYPETFFNIPHPTTPSVQIQFRTKVVSSNLNDPNIWENIVFNPNNFFNSLKLETSGEIKKLSLSLNDKNHSFLEDKIIRMTQATLTSSQKTSKAKISFEGYIETFNFSFASIRIRFGYGKNVIQQKKYKERTNEEGPTFYTPWMFFIPTGMEVSINESGLNVEIEAVGESYQYLDSLQIVSKFSMIEDEPENIISIFKEYLEATVDGVEVIQKDDPIRVLNDEGNPKLQIILGDKKSEEAFSFKSISNILNDFCSKVPPVLFDTEENLIDFKDYEEMQNNLEKKHVSYKYSWMVEETGEKNENGKDKKLLFYYRVPDKKQKLLRTYVWGEHGQSVLRNVSISSESLFSQINLPVFISDDEGNHEISRTIIEKDGFITQRMTELLDSSDFSFTFVGKGYGADSFSNSNGSIKGSSSIMANQSANIQEVLHKGSITIQGDPFFLFDDYLIPFVYKINLIIKKPTYINEEGIRVGGGKSYLSGEYVITKINHDFSANDFTTQLEVMRAI